SPPSSMTLGIGIRLTFDPAWGNLLRLEVAGIDGTKTCSSSNPPPECIDPADLVIASENSCSGWLGTLSNIDIIKALLISQLTSTLQSKLDDALARLTGRPCGPGGECPTHGSEISFCQANDSGTPDAGVGTCFDPVEGRCVPRVIGVEGRAPLGTGLDL